MSWLDDYKAQQHPQPSQAKQRPIETTCPDCGNKALIWKVRKEGRNKGRPIRFCQDKDYCRFQKFMDLPTCKTCGEECFEKQVMGGKNKGRCFRACPNRCSGAFRWVK
jgi:ribosomal protein S27E